MFVLVGSASLAQPGKKFATAGDIELGGSISFQTTSPVYNGRTGDAMTIFSLSPFIGFFVANGLEVGLNPLGITVISYSGSSATSVMVFAAPSYNLNTGGNVYPFIEALLGYTAESNSSSVSGFSWGGRGGLKIALTGKGLLNLGVQYLQITLNPSGATSRNGENQLAISAGFSVWF